MIDTWKQWNGDYEKEYYLVRVDGEEILCWPNAGYMNALDGTNQQWTPADKVEVKQTTYEEFLKRIRSKRARVKCENLVGGRMLTQNSQPVETKPSELEEGQELEHFGVSS